MLISPLSHNWKKYCRMGNDCCCNIFTIFAVVAIGRRKIPNGEIIGTQICPDIKNSENFTKQIFPILQYLMWNYSWPNHYNVVFIEPELEVPKNTEWQEQISQKHAWHVFWSLLCLQTCQVMMTGVVAWDWQVLLLHWQVYTQTEEHHAGLNILYLK